MPFVAKNSIHVAVGVIINDQQQVLIAKRPNHLHQGGLWEFPGGKVDEGENVKQALVRELHEELDLNVLETSPLITIPHEYKDKQVYLDVHWVTGFKGQPHGKEGQEVRWVGMNDLAAYTFPEANHPILRAMTLPDKYVISGKFSDFADCEQKVKSAIERGIYLIQLRAKDLSDGDYLKLAKRIAHITEKTDAKLILNTSLELFEQTNADGLHYTGKRLAECTSRPVPTDKLFSVSCHTEQDLKRCVEIGADFAMLSPVLPTASHPGEPALGWDAFSGIVKNIPIPVYALGGMSTDLLDTAKKHGAQGIAAISALWKRVGSE